MNETLKDVAKRAVKCKSWKWLPGMLCIADEDGFSPRIVSVGTSTSTTETIEMNLANGDLIPAYLNKDALPDFKDAATMGCLLWVVKNAYDDNKLVSQWNSLAGGGWIVTLSISRKGSGKYVFVGRSEASALVDALEDAP